MDKPTKHSQDMLNQLRQKYLRVLNEPIPPNLMALVERLREMERLKKESDEIDEASF